MCVCVIRERASAWRQHTLDKLAAGSAAPHHLYIGKKMKPRRAERPPECPRRTSFKRVKINFSPLSWVKLTVSTRKERAPTALTARPARRPSVSWRGARRVGGPRGEARIRQHAVPLSSCRSQIVLFRVFALIC